MLFFKIKRLEQGLHGPLAVMQMQHLEHDCIQTWRDKSARPSQESAAGAPAAQTDELAYICGQSAQMPSVMEMSRSGCPSTPLTVVGQSEILYIFNQTPQAGEGGPGAGVSATDTDLSKYCREIYLPVASELLRVEPALFIRDF